MIPSTIYHLPSIHHPSTIHLMLHTSQLHRVILPRVDLHLPRDTHGPPREPRHHPMIPETGIVDCIHGREHKVVRRNRHRIVGLTAVYSALRVNRRGCSGEIARIKRGGRECVEHVECWVLNMRFLELLVLLLVLLVLLVLVLLLLLVLLEAERIRCGIKDTQAIVEVLHVGVAPIRLRGDDLDRRTGGNLLCYSGSSLTSSGGSSSLLAVELRLLRFLLNDLVPRQQVREEAGVEHRGMALVNSDLLRAECLNETFYQLDDPLALFLVQEWHWVLAQHLDKES